MAILVTGGAGYIGSAMVDLLLAKGEQVVVLDNLHRGHWAALDRIVPFFHGEMGDRALVEKICDQHEIEACIHFAALAYVSESVSHPKLYFERNVEQGLSLLDSLMWAGIRRFVLSSTCATYGEPVSIPIDETHPPRPTNPYGWTKLTMENILKAYEVIEAARRITGCEIRIQFNEPRPGDPSRLVANCERAREILGWNATRTLDAIIESAWKWHQAHPQAMTPSLRIPR